MLPSLIKNVILKLTLPGLVTDGTIQWMVQQIELKNSGSLLPGQLTIGENDLAIGDRGLAGGGRFGPSLHLHQAQPTHGRRRKTRVIAVMRDFDPHRFCCPKNGGPRRNRYFQTVDAQRDCVRTLLISH
jgi:hypothetical protein